MAGSGATLPQQPVTEEQGQEQEQPRFKYLDFVHVAAVQAVVCLWRLYGYAKESSGPLKPGVEVVEGTVRSVVGPVYYKFHDVLPDLLKVVGRKVHESLGGLDRHLPSPVKAASAQARSAAQWAPEVARSVAGEVHRAGVVGTAVDLAREVATRCEPAVERCATAAWSALNHLPLFPQAAQVVVPAAVHCSRRYNSAVCDGADKGYTVAAYLPLMPTERIAKVLSPAGADTAAAAAEEEEQ